MSCDYGFCEEVAWDLFSQGSEWRGNCLNLMDRFYELSEGEKAFFLFQLNLFSKNSFVKRLRWNGPR